MDTLDPRVVAFVPARSGSKRVPDKNIKLLNGHPLLAYTIQGALQSAVFESVICATDSPLYADIAKYYGAEVPFLRSPDISGDSSPDIEWVQQMLSFLEEENRSVDYFSILRPTSPFRLPAAICRAWDVIRVDTAADSIRAVEPCNQHPGKMWVINGDRMVPLLPFSNNGTPWHSSQYAALPEVYEQNASLEIAKCSVVSDHRSIAGQSIIPFVSEGLEGFDINRPEDWVLAELYLSKDPTLLPEIQNEPYSNTVN